MVTVITVMIEDSQAGQLSEGERVRATKEIHKRTEPVDIPSIAEEVIVDHVPVGRMSTGFPK